MGVGSSIELDSDGSCVGCSDSVGASVGSMDEDELVSDGTSLLALSVGLSMDDEPLLDSSGGQGVMVSSVPPDEGEALSVGWASPPPDEGEALSVG